MRVQMSLRWARPRRHRKRTTSFHGFASLGAGGVAAPPDFVPIHC
jgi:hypothetical protein